jgi:XTP/dITP diphosphohydrolase
MASPVFLATSNHHKISEFRTILGQLCPHLSLLTLLDHPDLELAVAENGDTYATNALLKAQAYATRTPHPVIADDSGMTVAAFPQLLGVHSHRWHSGSDHDRVLALLQLLASTTDRRLTYQATICYLAPAHQPQFFSGALTGHAATHPEHTSGFGYDPIFIPTGYDQTLSALGPQIKNRISHRRQAISHLATYLASIDF